MRGRGGGGGGGRRGEGGETEQTRTCRELGDSLGVLREHVHGLDARGVSRDAGQRVRARGGGGHGCGGVSLILRQSRGCEEKHSDRSKGCEAVGPGHFYLL